ncbi:MAG: S8 family serine peptidase, partial [Kiritimatiellia bacterium]
MKYRVGIVMMTMAARAFVVCAQGTAGVMDDVSAVLRDPAMRQNRVDARAEVARVRRAAAWARATQRGLPVKGEKPGGGAFELIDFDGERPLYRATCNANAAISSGANLLWAAPYGVTGNGGTVGVWDASSALTTHQEYGGRVTTKDGSGATYDHSSHVVGTVCAAGIDAAAKGMAPAVRVDSYDWDNDSGEMTARGAALPGEAGMLNISSHSYGINAGWVYTQTPVYTWYGAGTTAAGYEDHFGQYNTYARDIDVLAYSLPYYLIFWAAGNDRSDNPATGNAVALSPGGASVSYDPALHPPGDRTYKGGYDTVSYEGLGKNVLTVGALTDAVSGGLRSPGSALMTSFSSWGPTDDGRIKPDVVANGYYLRSTSYAGDTSYSTMSGTSMATPSAAGSAHLLVHLFHTLFTNQVMRASTLKALLIHTADDKGNAGPDYEYGWGLINAQAAAELLADYRSNAGTRRVVEDRVATSRTQVDVAFAWDGSSPIKATLCWTDPAGTATVSHDDRGGRLVNNLDLRVIGPDAAIHRPWVMPFVGDWSVASCAYAATVGSNATDTVEQVLIVAPAVAGVYTVRVTFAGTLTNGSQPFSLILSGVTPSQRAPAPVLTASSPSSGVGTLDFSLSGEHLMLGATVSLKRLADEVPGSQIEMLGDSAAARIDTTGMAGGWWRMAVANPDGQKAELWNAFAVPETLWQEPFETNDIAAKGWAFLSDIGTSQWVLSAVKAVSP